jgi:hypothetical protein
MKSPFKTSEDLKKSLSGIDLKLDLENIQSSLDRVPNDLLEVIGPLVYADMMSHFDTPKTDNVAVWDELVELCQKAMFPMAIYKHFIWLQLRVSNKGVTTFKGDNETTAYRYQTDEAKESLLDAWSDFVSQIIDHLNANIDVITNWPNATQYAAQNNSLFKDFREFSKIANIRPADAAFFLRISDMLIDIAGDEVESILGPIADLDDSNSKFRKAQKYAAFRAMSLSAIQFDISAMPKPMRQVLLNEMNNKNNQGFDYAKKNLAGYYKQEAESWLQKISDDLAADAESESLDEIKELPGIVYSGSDKIAGIC